ncbi:MAG: hypothetical protein LIO65_00305, partial [Odoribacter sp.]|nr:hypothetical protein [Odoribacter sp.]
MLGYWDQSKTILNNGIGGRFVSTAALTQAGWDERYLDWFGRSNSYHNLGICGNINASQYDLPTPDDAGYDLTEEERIRIYDMALLDE